ncbi:unnamed protein product [Hermetia illucens]|uniref:Adenylyltransferase and sulfurtransferase MOCS3 homolog n=1 Tax=Hermetia illucens TaxID=343691 RepID=A0A7R8V410_HERIL|nr:adenylyltransferase and sulfurtransferase MOCS3 [Hermetia illucens]CAD7091255.1 unnamed protein product [Hermetia illucens]
MEAQQESIAALEAEIRELQASLQRKKDELHSLKQSTVTAGKLTNNDIARYSRQIILPQVTVAGQLKLKASSVLIVGAGGLGCPAGLYLASAGIGELGIVDYDTVEVNNLHRQVLHSELTLNLPKAQSARAALQQINSQLKVRTYEVQLKSENALEILQPYDIVLDCTDNVATRYLLNDACVLLKKPLVSGSALQFEGQLTIYNYNGGPCYRCIFPTPPPPETVTNCGDGGVLGAVTGVIGSLQALEAVKVLLKLDGTLAGRLLIFDGTASSFRNVKLRPRREDCAVCSAKATITKLIDYEQFCGMRASDKDMALKVLQSDERISVEDLKSIRDSRKPHLVIDVRNPLEFEICHIEGSVNIPLKQIIEDKGLDDLKQRTSGGIPVFVFCRRGNDSQLAVKHLRKKLEGVAEAKDVVGGLHAWHYRIDNNFPIY